MRRLVPILALTLLVGCGGSSTTVIKKTVTRASGTPTTSTSTSTRSTSTHNSEQTCGTLRPVFAGGPRQTVYATKLDCRTARRLAKQVTKGGLTPPWGCAASAVACENSATGAKFHVDDNTPPGEQYCPKGLIAVGADTCAPPPTKRCSPDVVQKASPDQVAAFRVTAQNADCTTAVQIVRQAAACKTICPGPFSGLSCRIGGGGAICKGSAYREVSFKVGYYGD